MYINAYTWNLEKWYRWSYLQSRDTGVENNGYQSEGGGREELWDWDLHMYNTDTMYKTDN